MMQPLIKPASRTPKTLTKKRDDAEEGLPGLLMLPQVFNCPALVITSTLFVEIEPTVTLPKSTIESPATFTFVELHAATVPSLYTDVNVMSFTDGESVSTLPKFNTFPNLSSSKVILLISTEAPKLTVSIVTDVKLLLLISTEPPSVTVLIVTFSNLSLITDTRPPPEIAPISRDVNSSSSKKKGELEAPSFTSLHPVMYPCASRAHEFISQIPTKWLEINGIQSMLVGTGSPVLYPSHDTSPLFT
mmetsp:Transcript_7877/g.10809  ORF Transcript_7877/g.10809 Transcript_7877/m.10809 type:complete len:246 (-) Transcript_7877:501-1238(-)